MRMLIRSSKHPSRCRPSASVRRMRLVVQFSSFSVGCLMLRVGETRSCAVNKGSVGGGMASCACRAFHAILSCCSLSMRPRIAAARSSWASRASRRAISCSGDSMFIWSTSIAALPASPGFLAYVLCLARSHGWVPGRQRNQLRSSSAGGRDNSTVCEKVRNFAASSLKRCVFGITRLAKITSLQRTRPSGLVE